MRSRLTLLALSGTVIFAAPWAAASPNQSASESSESCEIPRHVAIGEGKSLSDFQKWQITDEAQATIRALGGAIDEQFGDSSLGGFTQLRRGYIGTAIDDSTSQFVVVVDPTLVDPDLLTEKLEKATEGKLPLRVSAGCVSAERLVEAGEQIANERGQSDNWEASGDLDPYTSTWVVAVSGDDPPFLELERSATDSAISVHRVEDAGSRESGGRANDAQPHWMGAKIQVGGSNCTSGVMVDTQDAGKAMLSAGHCGVVGDNVTSGTYGYGTVRRRANLPEFDMLLINGDNQNYDDDIYMNPIDPVGSPVDVSGSGSIAVGNTVCVSGGVSLVSCYLEVDGLNGFLCDYRGCTSNLIRYDAATDGASTMNGDSGAPVFYRAGGTATIVGLHIGKATQSDGSPANGNVAHKVGTIQNQFNVTVATAP